MDKFSIWIRAIRRFLIRILLTILCLSAVIAIGIAVTAAAIYLTALLF